MRRGERSSLTLGWCEEAAPEFVLTLLRRGARLRCLGLCEQPEEPAAAGGLSGPRYPLSNSVDLHSVDLLHRKRAAA